MPELIRTMSGRLYVTVGGDVTRVTGAAGDELARQYAATYGLVPDEREVVLPESPADDAWLRWAATLGRPEVGR